MKSHDSQMQTLKKKTIAPLTSRKAFDEEVTKARKELLAKLIADACSGELQEEEGAGNQIPDEEPLGIATASRTDLTEEEDVNFL
jgi:hypothetical protein